MRRSLYLIALTSIAIAAAVGLTSGGFADRASGQAATSLGANDFVGYWMGTDPLDGGDTRRGLTRNSNGKFSLAGRDSVITLCDSTDRGFASFENGVASGTVMTTNDFTITCFNNGSTVTLLARYELLDANLMRETLKTTSGTLVTVALFHRVSER
jgi:hypothetical protein